MSERLLCLVFCSACAAVSGAQGADMAFVRVEPGSFVMGDGARGGWDERPARTAAAFWTGNAIPEEHGKAQEDGPVPWPVSLCVWQYPANPSGLHELHVNLEEWFLDWHAPYTPGERTAPAVHHFEGPIPFVKIAAGADGPLFARHNPNAPRRPPLRAARDRALRLRCARRAAGIAIDVTPVCTCEKRRTPCHFCWR